MAAQEAMKERYHIIERTQDKPFLNNGNQLSILNILYINGYIYRNKCCTPSKIILSERGAIMFRNRFVIASTPRINCVPMVQWVTIWVTMGVLYSKYICIMFSNIIFYGFYWENGKLSFFIIIGCQNSCAVFTYIWCIYLF